MANSFRKEIVTNLCDIYLILDNNGYVIDYYQENSNYLRLTKDDINKSIFDLQLPTSIKQKVNKIVRRIINNKKDISYILTYEDNNKLTKIDFKAIFFGDKIGLILKNIEPDYEEGLKIKSYLRCYEILNKLPTIFLDIDLEGKVYFANLAFYKSFNNLITKKFNFYNSFEISINEKNKIISEIRNLKVSYLEKTLIFNNKIKTLHFTFYEGIKNNRIISEIKECSLCYTDDFKRINNLEVYKSLIENLPYGILLRTFNGKIVYLNKKAQQILGINKNLLNDEFFIYDLIHPEDIDKVEKRIEMLSKRMKVPYDEIRIIRPNDKKEIIVESTIDRVVVDNVVLIQVTFREITKIREILSGILKDKNHETYIEKLKYEIEKRLNTEKYLNELLKEKTILIQEIQHRVKNNLQVINSIIRIELSKTQNQEAKLLLSRILARLNSIYILLDTAYNEDIYSNVDFSKFINCLSDIYVRNYENKVYFSNKLDKICVSLDVGIPLAMIINEVLNRFFEFSYQTILEQTNLQINLLKGNFHNEVQIVFPANSLFFLEQPDEIWFSLLNGLCGQINGTIQFFNDNNFIIFQIKF